MADDQKVTLNREEAELVDEALGDYLNNPTGLASEVAAIRARGFRLQVKLSKILPNTSITNFLPDWALPILQRTFAPDQVQPPKKKPAPAKAGTPAQVKPAAAKPKRALPKSAGLGMKVGNEA